MGSIPITRSTRLRRLVLKKALKILAILLGVVILGIVLLAVALPLLIDPNDYKDEIIETVKAKTGRDLKIEGKIDLSVFPWLGLEIAGVELANAPGFDDAPFARIESAGLKVKVLPLLRRQLQVDTVRLDGLRLELARNRAGKTNWDDLLRPAQAQPAPPGKPAAPAAPGIAVLTVGGIDIRNGEVRWQDQTTRTRYAVYDLALRSGEIAPPKPVDLRLAFELETGEPAMRIPVRLDTRMSLDLAREALDMPTLALAVDAMEVSGRLQATNIMGAPIVQGSLEVAPFNPLSLTKKLAIDVDPALLNAVADVSLKTEFKADLGRQLLDLSATSLNAAGIALTGSLAASELDRSPRVTGELAAADLDLRALMKRFDVAYETADENALSTFSFRSSFSASADRVMLQKLDAKLDESALRGSLSLRNLAKPAYAFNLALDQIDLDRYLAPAAPAQTDEDVIATLPLDLMRDLNLEGKARIGKLRAFGIRSTDVSINVAARNGRVAVGPNQAALYGGRYRGKTVVDVRRKTPTFALNEKLTGVQLGPFLKDAGVYDKVSGIGDVTLDLTARGVGTPDVLRTLNGAGAIRLRDGKIEGVNLQQSINDARAKYDELRGKPVKVSPKATDETLFRTLSATLRFSKGVASNDDLNLQGANVRATGKGVINLPKDTIDYRLLVSVAEAASRTGTTVPVDIGGALSAPAFSVAWNEVLKAKAKAAVEEKIEEKKEEKKEELRERLKEKLKRKLKF